MKLLTQEIIDDMPAPYSTEDTPLAEKRVVVKFFHPCSVATWYVFEGERVVDGDEEDWIFFGWAELLPGCGEMGSFSLSELQSAPRILGLGVERDLYIGNPKFGETRHGKAEFSHS